MADDGAIEGKAGVGRVEAFSDGVFAIIVTIMALELEAPEQDGIGPLLRLWPTLFAYVLSYGYVAIYWINHHRLFGHARVVTSGLLWSNIALLFALSFVPFSAAYLGKHLSTPAAAMLYNCTMLSPALAYYWLQRIIQKTGQQSAASLTYYHAMRRKGVFALFCYAVAIPIGAFWPAIGVGIPGLVALLWVIPWGPLDRLFAGPKSNEA
jgi:uncharacterized membrane protein